MRVVCVWVWMGGCENQKIQSIQKHPSILDGPNSDRVIIIYSHFAHPHLTPSFFFSPFDFLVLCLLLPSPYLPVETRSFRMTSALPPLPLHRNQSTYIPEDPVSTLSHPGGLRYAVRATHSSAAFSPIIVPSANQTWLTQVFQESGAFKSVRFYICLLRPFLSLLLPVHVSSHTRHPHLTTLMNRAMLYVQFVRHLSFPYIICGYDGSLSIQ